MADRSIAAPSTSAARSSGRTAASAPPYLPIGVRTASTIQASVMTGPVSTGPPVDPVGIELADQAELLAGGLRRFLELVRGGKVPGDAAANPLERLAGVQGPQAHLGAGGPEVEDRPVGHHQGRSPAGHAQPAPGVAAVEMAGARHEV